MDMPPSGTRPNGGRSNHMMMHISFYLGKDAIVLFSRWPNQNLGMTKPIVGGLTQATVYAFRMGLAYLVMLSVMSFNLGIFIAAVAGHALGFIIIKTCAIAIAKPAENMSSPSIMSKV
ncbi:hypothetical protein CIPAW_10G150700 [Carya illinoinensis]|uniref:Copper transport protein n=1 Tax=Carya illinoinensis TaxID=32201 RepID=A0A8T1PDC0_CARIL|nr:hypothetical protein CIPAW_10G150700 [Carya illinoinensis]